MATAAGITQAPLPEYDASGNVLTSPAPAAPAPAQKAAQPEYDASGNIIAPSAPSASAPAVPAEKSNKVVQVRYQVPDSFAQFGGKSHREQGVQEFTKGSTDEQQFLSRFPTAKAISSYERDLLPGEKVDTESPEARSERETHQAKVATAAAVGGTALAGTAGIAAGLAAPGTMGGVVTEINEGFMKDVSEHMLREVERLGAEKEAELSARIAQYASKPGVLLKFAGGALTEKLILSDMLTHGKVHEGLMQLFGLMPAKESKNGK